MATAIKDTGLEEELQELYIISSHWKADISFVQDEIRILKNALNKYQASAQKMPVDETAHFYKILNAHDTKAQCLKNKITVFMKFVELFIIDPKKQMGVDMLENFSELGSETLAISGYIKLVKGTVYAFIEDAIRNGKYADVQAAAKAPRVNIQKSIIYTL